MATTQTPQSVPKSLYEKKLGKISKEIEECDKQIRDYSREEHKLEVACITLIAESSKMYEVIKEFNKELKNLTKKAVGDKLRENRQKIGIIGRQKNWLSTNSIQLQTEKTKLIHMDMCKTLVKKNENEKKIEKKQLVKKSNIEIESSKKFLNEIKNNLPEEIVSYIGKFIPVTVRIQLLESHVDFTKLTKYISNTPDRKKFLEKVCNCPEYLNSMSNIQRKRHMISNTSNNPYYSPDWHISFRSKGDIQMMFQYAILTFKSLNPEHAFKVMKTLCILFDPTKNYRYNANYSQKVGNYSL